MHRHHPRTFEHAEVAPVYNRATGQDAIRIQVKRPPLAERTPRMEHLLAVTAYGIAARLEQLMHDNVALHQYTVRVSCPAIGLVEILLPLTGGVVHEAEDLAVEACADCGLEAETANTGPLG